MLPRMRAIGWLMGPQQVPLADVEEQLAYSCLGGAPGQLEDDRADQQGDWTGWSIDTVGEVALA